MADISTENAFWGIFLIVLILSGNCIAETREYFVAAVQGDWNYAPSGQNLVNPGAQSEADTFLQQGSNRIGSVYTKVIYKGYTDATFSQEIPKPEWLGLIGPIIRAEVGDVILVHFRNTASREYSMHPHGLLYDKKSEGAVYLDGTSGKFKLDDIVMPGETIIYTWNVSSNNAAPSAEDPNCLPWVYHSHIDTTHDTNAGLIGVLVLCRKGTLNTKGERNDVDRDYAIVFKVFDENLSWLANDNVARCGDPTTCSKLRKDGDADFVDSNMMSSINGYVFGNLRGLDACTGENITWYIVGMGTEVDFHSVHFHGQTINYEHKSGDTVSVFPAVSKTGRMTPTTPGHWLINCMVSDHFEEGMTAFFNVTSCGKATGSDAETRTTRRYYLAVEEEEWDYGPTGFNQFHQGLLNQSGSASAPYFTRGPGSIGGKYKKVRFHEYTDISYTIGMPQADPSLGILGPVIRVEIGDELEVVLRNKANRTYSFLGHTLGLKTVDEGIFDGVFHHGLVKSGALHFYHLNVPVDLLGNEDPDCLVQLYYSAVDPVRDINSGLIGPMLICKRGKLDSNGKQVQISKEFFLLFSTFDENLSWYLDDNIRAYCSSPASVNKDDPDFVESNRMHGINGKSFGNLDGLKVCLNEKVTWHVMAYGDETDVQAPYFHGNAYSVAGTHRDTGALISGSVQSLLMVPDNPGKWAVLSETNTMYQKGMATLYSVDVCGSAPPVNNGGREGKRRQYYIAAEEVDWDYAPIERSLITGVDLNDPRAAFIYVRDDDDFIGDTYRKSVFREYTDSTFTTRKTRGRDGTHLGIQGPVIRAEVGDVIEIIFKNKASRPFTIHPHGLMYDKANEGSSYADGLFLTANHGIQPGSLFLYHWQVPERAGPGSADPNCIPWPYYSAVNPAEDVFAGLFGTIVICRKNTLDATGKRKDVDREFSLLFSVFDENVSWYMNDNIQNHAPARRGTDYQNDPDFQESNKMASINGFIAGNSRGIVMKTNETIAWYLLSFGSEIDVHTVHFHGHTVLHNSHHSLRTDVITIFPGNAEVVEMKTDNPGTWILHCHVLDHITTGMETTYTVVESDEEFKSCHDQLPNEIFG